MIGGPRLPAFLVERLVLDALAFEGRVAQIDRRVDLSEADAAAAGRRRLGPAGHGPGRVLLVVAQTLRFIGAMGIDVDAGETGGELAPRLFLVYARRNPDTDHTHAELAQLNHLDDGVSHLSRGVGEGLRRIGDQKLSRFGQVIGRLLPGLARTGARPAVDPAARFAGAVGQFGTGAGT